MASPFLRNFYLLKETRTMTPEVQQYLLAGFLLLAAVFAALEAHPDTCKKAD